jgi:transposase
MGSPGTRYSKEFKAEAVNQVIDRGYSVREVAERIGVSQHSLYAWVRRQREAQAVTSHAGSPSGLAAEVARLKSELKRTQEERDILRNPGRSLWLPPARPPEPRRTSRTSLSLCQQRFQSSALGVRTFSWTVYATSPRLARYSTGLKPPSESLIRFSLYHRMYSSTSLMNCFTVVFRQFRL